ncbi:MAG TPA: outer membrane lipoprotein-sorting protein [Acidobacteriota bacterium]|jgi:outer membrane lipoprotein-sorting protein
MLKRVLFLILVFAVRLEAQDAAAILHSVDGYRNPLDGFVLDVMLTSFHDEEKETSGFRVFGQGSDKSLVEFRSPASERGKYLLMLRDDLWIYMPNTSRPIRISPLQRLMGEASNGDVARTNFSVDYTAQLAGEESVDGRAAYILELAARDVDIAYKRVRLWVGKRDREPIKAEFYVASGKLVKRVRYQEFGNFTAGRVVTRMEIQDAIRPGRRTVMEYSNLQPKALPDKMFNKNYLGKW